MPLPLIIDKLLSFGKRVADKIASSVSNLTSRITTKLGKLGEATVTVVKSLALVGAVAAGVSLVVVGGVVAISAIASLGTIGALCASFLVAGGIAFTLTQVVSTIVQTSNFIVNFNINKSDSELDQELISKLESFYGLLGNVVGSSMGYLVCGALPGAG